MAELLSKNFDFSDIFKISLFWSNKDSSVCKISKRIFSGLFSLKIPVRKHTMFWKIGKFLESFDFLDTFKTTISWSEKHSFLPKNSEKKLFFLNYICPKKSLDKIFEFLKKNYGRNPNKNFRFFWLFQNFTVA